MSEEIFGAVQKLPVNGTKKQVVLQCAPLLTGIKLSNLLNVRSDQKEEVLRIFEGSPVCCRVLYEFQGRLSILLYRPGMLAAYLEREDVKKLMTSFGYENPDLEETLNRIADAYQDHMNGKRGFPPASHNSAPSTEHKFPLSKVHSASSPPSGSPRRAPGYTHDSYPGNGSQVHPDSPPEADSARKSKYDP